MCADYDFICICVDLQAHSHILHLQDKHSRNKRESDYLTCSHAKAKGKTFIIVLCSPCVSLLSGSVNMSRFLLFFCSISLFQRGRFNEDFDVDTVLTN